MPECPKCVSDMRKMVGMSTPMRALRLYIAARRPARSVIIERSLLCLNMAGLVQGLTAIARKGAPLSSIPRMVKMKKFVIAAVAVALVASEIMAGPFGRFRRGGYSTGSTTTNNAVATNNVATGTVSYSNDELYSAQGVANRMARILRMGHLGNPTGGYEGVGMASTPQGAIQNCCFYGRRPLRDSGVAQGANGMWYACCRYH
jgi:hypothetical protein